ncbi:MAG TPA: GNAT family N-acetyltransferase [Gaiellaceae bacterium]|nr:GNAT family N-acetyltransferase [Gaiellaceae bacterium]
MLAYPEPPLADGDVALRRWEIADIALVEEASGDVELLPGTTLPREYTASAGIAFVERQWSRQTSDEGLSLAITVDGAAVGCATLMIRRPRVADLGYWLVERARGRGIARRSVAQLVEWALRQPEVDAVEAFVADDNQPSRRLLEAIHFSEAGRSHHRVNDLELDLLVYRRS